jgi:hypothetical protein
MEMTTANSSSDVEAGGKVEVSGEEPVNIIQYVHPRDGIKSSQWILTCVVLYLGALLYGRGSLITAPRTDIPTDTCKAWIPRSPPMSKRKCTRL